MKGLPLRAPSHHGQGLQGGTSRCRAKTVSELSMGAKWVPRRPGGAEGGMRGGAILMMGKGVLDFGVWWGEAS